MLTLLRLKFCDHDLRMRIVDTYPEELVELNWWKDRYWGVYQGQGHNFLGRMLMLVRAEIIANGTPSEELKRIEKEIMEEEV
jgi:predicted NAD-dependent protein-ADP-ribosyltransferase YbiA (DUF1768 family)